MHRTILPRYSIFIKSFYSELGKLLLSSWTSLTGKKMCGKKFCFVSYQDNCMKSHVQVNGNINGLYFMDFMWIWRGNSGQNARAPSSKSGDSLYPYIVKLLKIVVFHVFHESNKLAELIIIYTIIEGYGFKSTNILDLDMIQTNKQRREWKRMDE